MSESLESVLLGTSGLTLLALIAAALSFLREPLATTSAERSNLARLFRIGILIQVGHATEELATGFHTRFPERFGLAPWSPTFFVLFNAAWVGIWLVSAAKLRGGSRLAFFPLWFFALGMSANGVTHPLLALSAGEYFPGLWTSPLTGVVGILLLVRLVTQTSPDRT